MSAVQANDQDLRSECRLKGGRRSMHCVHNKHCTVYERNSKRVMTFYPEWNAEPALLAPEFIGRRQPSLECHQPHRAVTSRPRRRRHAVTIPSCHVLTS